MNKEQKGWLYQGKPHPVSIWTAYQRSCPSKRTALSGGCRPNGGGHSDFQRNCQLWPCFRPHGIAYPKPNGVYCHAPVTAFRLQYLCSCHSFAAIDEVVCLLWFLPVFLCFRENNADPLQIRPFLPPLQPWNIFTDIAAPALKAPVFLAMAPGTACGRQSCRVPSVFFKIQLHISV